MGDIEIRYDAGALAFDWALDGPDLASDGGLKTAVTLSLFTDRRAGTDDDPPGGADDLRGWWGDDFAAAEGDLIGSRLWLLGRAKVSDNTLARAADYAEEALAWMVEDGVIGRVEVTAERVGLEGAALIVTLHRPKETPVQFRFESFWSAL